MLASKQQCYVYIALPGRSELVTAGRFRVSSASECESIGEFEYSPSYLGRSDAVPLDPVELVPGQEPFETRRLNGYFGAIRDAMPDHWGRSVLGEQDNTASDEFRFLLDVPDDRAGALGFGESEEPPPPGHEFAGVADLEGIQRLADLIQDEERSETVVGRDEVGDWRPLRTAMGGARPKTVIEDAGGLWIAKLGHRNDRWSHPRVEHGTLRLAHECGLTVADSRLHSVGNDAVLLVRRFDRERAQSGYCRHRMVSALTLLQTDDGLMSRSEWSYIDLADRIRIVSDRAETDLRELFCRMCFNAAISNSDDHPRNHAMVAEAQSWHLSPAYDLMPGPQIAEDRRDLAMSCGPFGRYANRENLVSACESFLLSREEACTIFDEIVQTVRDRWRQVMCDVGVDEAGLDRIKTAFVYSGLF